MLQGRKFQGAKVPVSKLARVLLELSLQGANWPGREKAQNHDDDDGDGDGDGDGDDDDCELNLDKVFHLSTNRARRKLTTTTRDCCNTAMLGCI